MLNEFKDFVMRGNVLDLAIAVIMGLAFGTVVNSLVNDVIMPPLGFVLGGVDFGNLFVDLSGQAYPSLKAAKDAGAPVIGYGAFLNTVVSFLVIAFVVFQIVKGINRLRPAPTVTSRDCPYCHTTIPINATRCPNCTSQLSAS